MLKSMWNRLIQSQFHTAAKPRRPLYRPLRFEVLEDRLTPSNFTTAINDTTLTITKIGSGSDNLTFENSGNFQRFTVNTSGGTTVNNLTTYTTPTQITAIVVKLGSGNDNLTFDGTANGLINLNDGLTITGTGGNKTIMAEGVNLYHRNALKISLTGNGSETLQFTDVNVYGTANITHSGAGSTSLTIDTSNNNTYAVNTWGTLNVTNGTGSDINLISDTDFTGSVVIKNGAGASNTSQFAGSRTVFSASNNTALLSVKGGLTVTTGSGHSSTEVFDYNVDGKLTVNTGSGISGQSVANYVGIQDDQTTADTVPVIGSVGITGNTRGNLNPGLQINLGTDNAGNDFPLVIQGALSINATGTGSVEVNLNNLTVFGITTVTLGSSTTGNTLNVQGDNVTAAFATFNVVSAARGNNTYNIQTVDGATNFAGSLTFQHGSGADTMNIGSTDGPVYVNNSLGISGGGGGSKILNALNTKLGSINVNLTGSSTETLDFTDVDVAGAANIVHTGTGGTTFTINTSSDNVDALNNWNSLSITNGRGSDLNTITDTNFAGSVTIKNGAGAGNTNQFAGSHTVISAINYLALLQIHGSLTITTGSGQSHSEIFDYDVHGNVTINTGSGIAGQGTANYVGIENDQTDVDSGIPMIGGFVSITGTAVGSLNPGLRVNLGTDNSNNDFPLVIAGNLTVKAVGSGRAQIVLNDLTVTSATNTLSTTTINLGANTHDNIVTVQGSTVTSVFDIFNITSTAGGNNTYNLQTQAGNLQMTGKVKLNLGNGNDTVNLAANSGNQNGVSNAIAEFFDEVTFDGNAGTDLLFQGTVGQEVFYVIAPVVNDF